MCGIAGFFSPNGDTEGLARDLSTAIACLRHRGPDDGGAWVSAAGAGIAQRRLSIIDLSARGHQPMVSKDGRFALVFNGEVYNYHAIRESLIALGHAVDGAGDAEVALAAFQQWDRRPLTGSSECLRWHSGMSVSECCTSSAIGSASSRSTTAGTEKRSGSDRSSKRCVRSATGSPRSTARR
jgi:asparagine synthase (glutamine-hydrolysing)